MSKRFKHKQLPACKKFDKAFIPEQFSKIVEEFQEIAEAYAIFCRKNTIGKANREDFKNLVLEAFDVSQSAQQFIHIAAKRLGNKYCLDEEAIYDIAIKKNAVRGYYENSRQ